MRLSKLVLAASSAVVLVVLSSGDSWAQRSDGFRFGLLYSDPASLLSSQGVLQELALEADALKGIEAVRREMDREVEKSHREIVVKSIEKGEKVLQPAQVARLREISPQPRRLADIWWADVFTKLRLSEDQGKQLEAVRREMVAELEKSRQEIAAKYTEIVEKLLRPAQVARLREISLQVRGLAALTDADVSKQLGLSEDQLKQIADKRAEGAKKVEAALRADEGRLHLEKAQKIEEIQQETDQAVLNVLSDAQKRQYTELNGKESPNARPLVVDPAGKDPAARSSGLALVRLRSEAEFKVEPPRPATPAELVRLNAPPEFEIVRWLKLPAGLSESQAPPGTVVIRPIRREEYYYETRNPPALRIRVEYAEGGLMEVHVGSGGRLEGR